MNSTQQIEELVVGRLIVEPSLLLHISVVESYFSNAVNRAVFNAIREQSSILKDGDDMHNIHQLGAHLENAGLYDNVGGLARLSEYYPAIGETFFYNLSQLKHCHHKRHLLHVLADAMQQLKESDTQIEDVIDSVMPVLSRCAEVSEHTKTMRECVRDEAQSVFDYIDALERGDQPTIGIPTGIATLDSIIGGLPIGVPSVVAARPGEGKSTLALNVANNVAMMGVGVHLFSYEDGERSFSQRMLALRTSNNLTKIVQRKLSADELMRIRVMDTQALEHIRIEKAHSYTARKIARAFRAHKRNLKTKLVIVDYLQLMPGVDRKAQTHEQLESNMKELAALAAQEDVAVLVLSQLKREAQGVEPKLNDLRGSGSIEQIGKLIIALHADHPESTELKFVVLKNFQGRRGYIYADYNRAECRIR